VEEKYKILLNTKFLLNQKRWSTRTLEIKENLSKKKKKKKEIKVKSFVRKNRWPLFTLTTICTEGFWSTPIEEDVGNLKNTRN
jgi:hypothetical protein